MTRVTMWLLLGVVATAAAVLSFDSLRMLADLCGFHRSLSWLLPVVVDAGAGCGCLIWLGTSSPVRALRFARALTWVLLASSVAGNAIVHGLSAYGLRPHWTLVVAVSAIAPGVLGATVHLSVLVGRNAAPSVLPVSPRLAAAAPPEPTTLPPATDSLLAETRALLPIGHVRLARELNVGEHQARKLLKAAKANNGTKVLTDA